MGRAEHSLRRWQLVSLLAAAAGWRRCAALSWEEPGRLWPAYLLGFLACWLVCMGGMGLLALGNLTGGRWALVARPFYRAANQLVPILAVSVCTDRAFHRAHLSRGQVLLPVVMLRMQSRPGIWTRRSSASGQPRTLSCGSFLAGCSAQSRERTCHRPVRRQCAESAPWH